MLKVKELARQYSLPEMLAQIDTYITKLDTFDVDNSVMESIIDIRESISVLSRHTGHTNDDDVVSCVKNLSSAVVNIDMLSIHYAKTTDVSSVMKDVSVEMSPIVNMYIALRKDDE